jgi:hypothetical protein
VVIVPGYYATVCWPGGQHCYWYPVVARGVYSPLKQVLERQGYREGDDLFFCLYNWMRPNSESGNKLGDCVNKALRKNPRASKVEIITHSNGGNVARAYIQNRSNPRVDKLLMIAPPNQGAVAAYWPWEGGDLSQLDSKLKARVVVLMLLYAEGWDCHLHPLKPSCIYQTLHRAAPSGRELLPVGEAYLIHQPDQRMIDPNQMVEKNTFLMALNQQLSRLFAGVKKVVIYSGRGQRTHWNIAVKDRDRGDAPVWADGKPVSGSSIFWSLQGDGTILLARARLPYCPPDKCDQDHIVASDHIGIISAVSGEILRELGLTGAAAEQPLEAQATEDDVLFFAARTSARFLVTDPRGRRFGYLSNGRFVSEIPGAEYAGEESGPAKLIAIPNPLREGRYRLQLSGTNLSGTETYRLGVVWTQNSQVELYQTGEVRRGETIRKEIEHRGFAVLLPFIER